MIIGFVVVSSFSIPLLALIRSLLFPKGSRIPCVDLDRCFYRFEPTRRVHPLIPVHGGYLLMRLIPLGFDSLSACMVPMEVSGVVLDIIVVGKFGTKLY
uniref:Uncharacterized protein n=1 Tax=Lactuca sativa TaxID=4236 RepID=A0A9R1V288_LACSA|nr:hypothetical protein LSAT_V11C700381860 [Lactuca sativa]